MIKKKQFLGILLLLLCTACSSAMLARNEYLQYYQQGDLEGSESRLSQTIYNNIPHNSYQKCKDAVWMLLDRATTRFASGCLQGAIEDYALALEALDFYNQNSPVEAISKILIQDDLEAYCGEDYEQVLARIYFALALLEQGDENNAFALLRQAEELQQKKRDAYAKTPCLNQLELIDNAIGKYLFACLLEKRKDSSNAAILYRQAGGLVGCDKVQDDLKRLESTEQNLKATIIVLCHNGNAPLKTSGICNASAASALALELILTANRLPPAISTLTGIPVPVLYQNASSMPLATIANLDSQQKPLVPWYDVAYIADQQLQQKMPIIIARGIARLLMRRAAIAWTQKKNSNAGSLIDIAMLAINASTKADTRSWTTLPNTFDLARFNVTPGIHSLSIDVAPHLPFYKSFEYSLELHPCDLCIINVFNIHPGITTILVPQRFLSNKYQGDYQ